jgi:hypothetical protein
MRIAISGTHASGKSTLISDFLAVHPEYAHEPEPFELLDDARDDLDADAFFHQLQISVQQLRSYSIDARVIAERCPVDFLAYLMALDELGRGGRSRELLHRAAPLTAAAMEHVDLLVILPLNPVDDITVPQSEDPELREVMNEFLLEISGDTELVSERSVVLELTGSRGRRLAALDSVAAQLKQQAPSYFLDTNNKI